MGLRLHSHSYKFTDCFAYIVNFATNNHFHTFAPSPFDQILATHLYNNICIIYIYINIYVKSSIYILREWYSPSLSFKAIKSGLWGKIVTKKSNMSLYAKRIVVREKYKIYIFTCIYIYIYVMYVCMLQRICGTSYFPKSLTRLENP